MTLSSINTCMILLMTLKLQAETITSRSVRGGVRVFTSSVRERTKVSEWQLKKLMCGDRYSRRVTIAVTDVPSGGVAMVEDTKTELPATQWQMELRCSNTPTYLIVKMVPFSYIYSSRNRLIVNVSNGIEAAPCINIVAIVKQLLLKMVSFIICHDK